MLRQLSPTLIQSQRCLIANPRSLLYKKYAYIYPSVECFSGSPPSYNPQNTDQPTPLPTPEFGAQDTVAVQLDALAQCDDPWMNHGIQLCYEFGYDIGGLDRSMYFGFPKDLYHLDHFMGQFQNQLPELVFNASYTLGQVEEPRDDTAVDATWKVPVDVVARNGLMASFVFHLRRKKVGTRKGSLMTYMIERQ